VVGIVEGMLFASFWTSITVWEVVQPRIVEPTSVYVYEKQAGDPASVLFEDLSDCALSNVMYERPTYHLTTCVLVRQSPVQSAIAVES
jgi:hypothetical protein